jgi:hypothetical protein
MKPVIFPLARTPGITCPLTCASEVSEAPFARAYARAKDVLPRIGRGSHHRKKMIMGLFSSSKAKGSSNGRSTRNSSAHGHKSMSPGRRQVARAEAWDTQAWKNKRDYGKGSPEHKRAQVEAKQAWRKVGRFGKWI